MHNNFVNYYLSIPVVKKRKKFEPKVFNFTSQCFKWDSEKCHEKKVNVLNKKYIKN